MSDPSCGDPAFALGPVDRERATMRSPLRCSARRTLIITAAALGLLAILFRTVYRPWQRTWGATQDEVTRAFPGDDIVQAPIFDATRAITIRATLADIWPWLVQMGYRRAGFYSHDWIDNDRIPSADRILPEYQDLSVGDTIPLSKGTDAVVRMLEPGRFLLLVVGEEARPQGAWTWLWALEPQDATHTRVVTRLRVRLGPVATLVLDAVEIVMMRKCLLGIKRRVEATPAVMPATEIPPE
jgi:hypothetical protein